ncbi:MAG: hypothetical protein CVU79_04175 [Elusimicrobia bacterium HGW-Elusimicrobia-3]|nr:MAG: hypothetical protein CVU79_04175 [Elusimicrobia bacterium HGW-Elusimicrobia-3]
MSPINRTAPIRRGFATQDQWAFRICLDILKNPADYDWMQCETAPDEVSGAFFLDDILVKHKDDTYTFLQVKHRQHATSPWTWDELLAQAESARGGLKTSLIQKWHRSISKPEIKQKIRLGKLLTNGLASPELNSCLTDNKIDVALLESTNPDIFAKVVQQLGSIKELKEFAESFAFCFSQPDFAEMDVVTRQGFLKYGATKAGLDNLLIAIQKECLKQETAPWTIQTIFENCEFSTPRHLNENFSIPADFQIFDIAKHSETLKMFKDIAGGIQVLVGNPGSGKSTYLAWLYKHLTGNGSVVLHHHYHINPSDPIPLARIQAQRVIEALKAQCKDHSELLGSLVQQNAENVSLRDFLNKIATELFTQGKTAILIIDGLDHALRQDAVRELKELLLEACVPQNGLWILLGTQVSARTYLPQIVFDKCPETNWIEIEGLTSSAVSSVVRKNVLQLKLPDNSMQLNDLCDEIYKLCSGNPLHLRYILNTLRLKKTSSIVTDYDCRGLLPYSDDIEQYYQALWRSLPNFTKSLALVFVSASFEPTQEQLCQIATALGLRVNEITEALQNILHLLKNQHGHLSIFHNSFREFLNSTIELAQQQNGLKTALRDWIRGSKYQDLKWAHTRILEYELGNPEPLLEIDRKWVIEAVSFPRPQHLIDEQLAAGTEAAFKTGRWGKCLELSTLREYLTNTISYHDGYFIPAWILAFELSPEKNLNIQFNTLAHEQLVAISREMQRLGRFFEIEQDVFSALNDKHRTQNVRANGDIGGKTPEIALSTIEILTLNDDWDVPNVLDYIRQYSGTGWAPILIGHLARRTIETFKFAKLDDIEKGLIGDSERYEFYFACAKAGLESKSARLLELLKNIDSAKLPPLGMLFCELMGISSSHLPELAPYLSLPNTIPEYDTGHREHRANVFYEGFLTGILCGLKDNISIIQEWERGSDSTWAHLIYSRILKAGFATGEKLKNGAKLDLLIPLSFLDDIGALKWPQDRDRLEYQHSLRLSLSKICTTLISLIRFQGFAVQLSLEEITALKVSDHFGSYNFIEFLDSLCTNILTQEQLRSLADEELDNIQKSSDTFPDRSSRSLKIARIAKIHADITIATTFLWKSFNYLLGYGSHKDPFLDRVMESIKVAHTISPERTKSHLAQLGPMAASIRDYTDGDDTRYFPEYLAEILVSTLPEYLPGYFVAQAQKENYFLAEDIFESVIKALDLSSPFSFALATTAIDSGSFLTLKKRAVSDRLAANAVNCIENYFGPMRFDVDKPSPSPFADEHKGIDFLAIPVSNISDKLDAVNNTWNKSRFLAKWANVHRESNSEHTPEIFEYLSKYIEQVGESQADAEILDVAYKLAFPHNKEKAFQYVAWAQANSSGWAEHFSSAEDARRRWCFIRANFPDRYSEFFQLSIERTGLRYGRRSTYFVPIPRGIEFLNLFAQKEKIDDIISASIEVAKTLIIDDTRQKTPWIDGPLLDSLDLLIQRLSWPGSLVRERAATALASLLHDSETSAETKKRLLNWISVQELESMVVYGILPFAKAASTSTPGFSIFTVTEIYESITTTSIAVDVLMQYIANHLNEAHSPKTHKNILFEAPVGYQADEFFLKYIKNFLPPSYLLDGQEISDNSGRPFINDWCFTANSIQTQLGIENDASVLDFMGHREDHLLIAVSTKQSEIYRSAFLRCLNGYYRAGGMSRDFYLDYALATIPIDLSLWQILPTRKPKWWPGNSPIQNSTDKGGLPNISYDLEIQNIIKTRDIRVLALDGRISAQQDSKISSGISLIGFGYKIGGPNLPSAEEIWKCVGNTRCELTPPSAMKTPIAHLESSSDYLAVGTPKIRIKDAEIAKLVGGYGWFTVPTWQWFRMRNAAPFGLTKDIFPSVNLSITPTELAFLENGIRVGGSSDWTDGVLEREDADIPPQYGHYIEVRNDFLSSTLKNMGLRLGFVLKLSVSVKEDGYGKKAKRFNNYKVFSFSPIIT